MVIGTGTGSAFAPVLNSSQEERENGGFVFYIILYKFLIYNKI